jgi:hypothetical protein
MLEEKKFIYINKKNILECSGNCRSLTEKDQIYEKKNFDNVFSTDEGPINKNKFNLMRKIQNLMLKGSIRILQGLFEFITGLIVRKDYF